MEQHLQRMAWRDNPDAVEQGFEYYLQLLERRIHGEDISLVQSLRQFYVQELGIDLRETQARGLMHRSSSVFIDYVQQVLGEQFVPNVEHWEKQGIAALQGWKQRFYAARDVVAVDLPQQLLPESESRTVGREGPAERRTRTTREILRDNALSRFLKFLYQSQCQICSFSFPLPKGGLYAECHHIRPLGIPDQGPDIQTNMLVLCPNHHAMMDYGAIAIHPENMTVLSIEHSLPQKGKPLGLQRHMLGKEFLEYQYANLFGH